MSHSVGRGSQESGFAFLVPGVLLCKRPPLSMNRKYHPHPTWPNANAPRASPLRTELSAAKYKKRQNIMSTDFLSETCLLRLSMDVSFLLVLDASDERVD